MKYLWGNTLGVAKFSPMGFAQHSGFSQMRP